MQLNAVRLLRLVDQFFSNHEERVANLITRAQNSTILYLQQESANCANLNSRLCNASAVLLQNVQHRFDLIAQKLENLNPVRILRMGYAQLENAGKVVSSVKDVELNDTVKLHLTDGTVGCKVVDKEVKNDI